MLGQLTREAIRKQSNILGVANLKEKKRAQSN